MKDIASLNDERGIDIQQVGVTGVSLPILILRKSGGYDNVTATLSLAVDLQHDIRGTHMSRFLEILEDWRQKPLSYREIGTILTDVIQKLNAKKSNMTVSFKYFLERIAPVSKSVSLMDYDIVFTGDKSIDGVYDFTLNAKVPVTALCPCSKEISKYGAHNQRAIISATVKSHSGGDDMLWIEDLIDLVEAQGSSQLYPLLKREDEKYVTEQAYENAKFVEDILRDTALALKNDARVTGFKVRVDSIESIHNHNVYAELHYKNR